MREIVVLISRKAGLYNSQLILQICSRLSAAFHVSASIWLGIPGRLPRPNHFIG